TERLEEWFGGRSALCDSVLVAERESGPRRRDVDAPARVLMAELGVAYVDRWSNPEAESFSVHSRTPPTVVDVREWDYLINVANFNVANFRPDGGPGGSPGPPGTPGADGEERFRVTADEAGEHLVVWDGNDAVLRFPLAEVLERSRTLVRQTGDAGNVPAGSLRFEREESGVRGVLQIVWLNALRDGDRDTLTGLNATVMLSLQ
ncbi:MAG: hypothetical protein HKN12_03060, partial [Gemmatimonadetes bacterium]|nr:hypothetical protein [Gemmatimonadota bacterium]